MTAAPAPGVARLASVGRRFVALNALRWLPTGLLIPVTAVLMQSRGLSLAQIGLVMAVQGAVVIVLELPTGGLSDALGRRPVLLVASALDIAPCCSSTTRMVAPATGVPACACTVPTTVPTF